MEGVQNIRHHPGRQALLPFNTINHHQLPKLPLINPQLEAGGDKITEQGIIKSGI
eukprot:CAMPEP_0115023124 /NCGR_PEP_ID=MMETSP0216-20121206/32141_1 /TAXON_ID=223996 /ORGANISM="Protocruzia adherens, Strain Boccale" /LENGTH=54 /DNA_ID=CAMNT_0002396303 /DNA_START=160 /DNA_END=324 /DNA_ORIENTATION=+